MKILMVAACPLPWPRGTPIRIHRMAEALQQASHEVCVVTYPMGDPNVPIAYEVHRAGSTDAAIDTTPGPSWRKLFHLDPLLCRALSRLLASRRFDVMHVHHYEGLVTGLLARALRRHTLPLVFDCHTLLGSELPHYRLGAPRAWVSQAGRALDWALPRRADHLIAVSPAMQDWFVASGVPGARVSLIPNGVEHEHFHVRPHFPQAAAKIVFAGNLAEYQGLDLLFDAFARVRVSMPEATLDLLTESNFDGFETRLQTRGLRDSVRCVWVDYASLPGGLAEATVLVNPRVDCEGIPQKVLNYMASARGIVSFESSRGPLQHEHTGLIVRDRDVEGLAAAIVRLLREPALADRLGAEARRQVIAQHGWHQVAEKVTGVYRRLVGARR